MAGLVCGFIPGDLAAPPAAAGACQAVALDALLAAVAVTLALWWSATQASVTLLVLAGANLTAASVGAPVRIRRAVRRGRRLRS
jgi:hypothetical protein